MISVRGVARAAVVAAVVVLTLHSRAALAEVKYTITDLGTLGGSDSWSDALNDSGEVVGGSTRAGGLPVQAYIYRNGLMGGLGSLGGLSLALGFNNAGVVVGRSNLSDNVTSRAFRWDSSAGMVDLGTLGGAQSSAVAINAGGDIVGWSQNTAGNGRAFLYAGGIIVKWYDLGTLGGNYSVAMGVNDSGQIVGSSTATPSSPLRATYWSSSISSPVDLGTLGGSGAEAFKINNNGVIVGYSYLPGDLTAHAFVYSGGAMADLGSFGGWSEAMGLNDAGDVVGSSRDPLNVEHAFLYSGGVVTDLNTVVQCPAGQYLRIANDINSSGQIAAQVYDTNTGTYHAVLLTPIPEPATLSLLALGGLMALRRRR
jgi:probable HAF family extracellular repeat protein